MSRALAAITGASAGIGTEFAKQLARRGYNLLLIARRRDRLEALAEELVAAHGITAAVMTADLGLEDDIDRVAERLRGSAELSLLVNNAGFGTKGRFWESPLDSQAQMHRVHIDAILRVTHAALGGMVNRRRGGVISVSSVAGF